MANTFKSPLQKAVVTWLTAHPDVTIAELARRAEIDKGDLSKINSGLKQSLNMESAARLAKAMGTTVEGLLSGETAAVPAPAPNAVRLDNQAIAVGVRLIPLGDIDPSPDNPRKSFDPDALAELAASIAEQGLLQPIVVRPIGKRFEIVAGERRFRALTLNKAETALCVVREGDDDGNTRALRIIENLQRADIKPLEEAEAFSALNAVDPVKWNATTIGKAIGKSDRFVAQRIAIARNLHADLKEKLAKGELKVEVARVMAAAPQKLQKSLANDHWALMDADNCRRKLQGKAIPVSSAAFKLEKYDGEFLEEGDKRWFADKAKFTRLQTEAADARVERLKKDYQDARRVSVSDAAHVFVWADNGQSVHTYWGDKRTEAKSRRRGLAAGDCTAIVWLADSKVYTGKNVVLREVWQAKVEKEKPGREDADDQPRQREETKEQKEAKAFNSELTTALSGRFDLAKRIMLYGFFGTNSGDLEINIDPRPHLGDQAEILSGFIIGDGHYLERYDPQTGATDQLWATLRSMEDGAVEALLARLLAKLIHVYSHGHADGRTRAIAEELGVPIPPRFVPEAQDDQAGAEPGDAPDQAEAA